MLSPLKGLWLSSATALTSVALASGFLVAESVPAAAVNAAGETGELPTGQQALLVNDMLDGDHSISRDLLLDLQYMAAKESVGLEELVGNVVWQQQFGDVVEEIATRYPGEYSGSRHSDEDGAWIGFRGEIPDMVNRLVESFERQVTLIPNQGFSYEELIVLMEETYQDASRHPAVKLAAGSVDDKTGNAVVEVEPVEELSTSERLALVAELRPSVSNAAVGVDITTTTGLQPFLPEVNLRGGTYLWDLQGSPNVPCTTGFAVRHAATGQTGVATAGHCGSNFLSRWYRNHATSSWNLLNRQNWHVGNSGDIAWYAGSGHLGVAQFYTSTSGFRNVTGIRSPGVGDRLCNFGISTGNKCATVVDIDVCAPAGPCRQTVMNAHVTAAGDSGGPWFDGNTAIGIHAGSAFGGSTFTPVGRLSNQFGAVVIRA